MVLELAGRTPVSGKTRWQEQRCKPGWRRRSRVALPSDRRRHSPRYAGVPSVRLSVSRLSKNWLCPKSPILTVPLPLSITFSGFTSP